MRLRLIPLLALFPFPLAGADDAPEQEPANLQLDPVTVVAHRQPRSQSEIAGSVTVIDDERMHDDMVIDFPDLVRYEPGVEVDGGGTRFGSGGFRIRGIGGNRTAVVVDNVPAADRFTVGSFADSGRGLIDLGLASRVEILRGPASTLYGSKALGGVTAITMLDAEDLLGVDDRGSQMTLATGTDYNRTRTTAATASRRGDYSLLVAGAGRKSGEANVPAEQTADTLDRNQNAALVRAARETANGRIRLTFDGIDESRDTRTRSPLGTGRFADTTSLTGDDLREQWKVLVDGSFTDSGAVSRGHWRTWHQVTDVDQKTFEERADAERPVDIHRRFELLQETSGLGLDFESDATPMALDNRLGYGIEFSRSDLTQRRDAVETDRLTGDSSSVVLGEVFPLRDFPRTRITEVGAYVHDEIHLWEGGPMLGPGLRFEHYDLETLDDSLFSERFPDADTTDLTTNEWLPRLGLVWPVSESLEWFVQYAEGFRPPPFEDVNIGLDIPAINARAIANPDLEPEQGRTVETGIRVQTRRTRFDLAVFRNDYRDFIESRAAIGRDPETDTLLFQSVNRDRVRIEGVELQIARRLPAGFDLELATEWLRGEDRATGRHLPEISPPKAVVSVRYAPDTSWDLRLATTTARSQRRLEDAEGNRLFSPPGYTTVDLIAGWQPHRDVRVKLGMFNLTDETYWHMSNVSGLPPDDPSLRYLAEPGRSISTRFELAF